MAERYEVLFERLTTRGARARPPRRTDLDALRSFAMLLGVALHASLSFIAFPWLVHDTRRSDLLPLVLVAVLGLALVGTGLVRLARVFGSQRRSR